jgi:hypothetical protein
LHQARQATTDTSIVSGLDKVVLHVVTRLIAKQIELAEEICVRSPGVDGHK